MINDCCVVEKKKSIVFVYARASSALVAGVLSDGTSCRRRYVYAAVIYNIYIYMRCTLLVVYFFFRGCEDAGRKAGVNVRVTILLDCSESIFVIWWEFARGA